MTSLEEIVKVRIPISSIRNTVEDLRSAGKHGLEGIALWVGQLSDTIFEVKDEILPIQSGVKTPSGLMVLVDGDELYRINRWLFEHKMLVIAQLHSHPGEAYHSVTDSSYPIVTTLGGFSVVVPNFASANFVLTECAVYRLKSSGWILLVRKEVESMFEVFD